MGEKLKKLDVEAVATVGGCRPTGISAADGVMTGKLAPGHRSVILKQEVLLRLLRAESVEGVSRELGVEIYQLEKWRDMGLSGIDAALKEQESDSVQPELGAAIRRIGELTTLNKLLWQRVENSGPLAKRRSSK